MKSPMPSQETLRVVLDYDPEGGTLHWKHRPLELFSSEKGWRLWNAKWAGKPAFTVIEGAGYPSAKMLGATRRAHRVIWKWMTGQEPQVIDHINGDRTDNRWSNLRATDWTGNSTNCAISRRNVSGTTGVYRSASGRWIMEIKYRGRRERSKFDSIEEAVAARREAEGRLGFHPNHGRRLSREARI